MAGTASTSHSETQQNTSSHGGSEYGSSSSGGSHSHSVSTTVGHSETSSESHSRGGSQSSSAAKSYASGTVDERIKQKKAQLEEQGYQQSDDVTIAKQRLYDSLNSRPSFESSFQGKLQDMYDDIVGMDKFRYDWNSDPMYGMYRDAYQQAGKDSMRDTVGLASQLSGGYANSYATSAGQQAYQSMLEDLNTKVIPQLRDQAFQEYQAEKQDAYDRFNLTNQMYQNDYNQYRDAVSDYQWQANFDQALLQSERNFDYNKFSDDRAYMQSEFWNQRNAEQSNVAAAETADWNDTYAHSVTDYWEQTTMDSDTSSWSHNSGWENNWNNTSSHTLTDANTLSASLAGGGGASSRAAANAQNANNMMWYNATDRYGNLVDAPGANNYGAKTADMTDEIRSSKGTRDIIIGQLQKMQDASDDKLDEFFEQISKAIAANTENNKYQLSNADKTYLLRAAGKM